MALRITPSAERGLLRLADRDRVAVVKRLEEFASGTAANADVRKLVDVKPATWRLRIGRFRALFRRIEGDVVVFDDHRDVYG